MVTYPSGSETVSGYLAPPDGAGHPAVVVIQEWWGLNEWVKSEGRSFRRGGYVALAPDLYGAMTTDAERRTS